LAVEIPPTIEQMSVRLKYLYRAYRYRFRVDPAEIRFVRQSLQPGQIAVDIGCHKGAYTYWMRRRVGPSGIVYAFEPQPAQVDYLRKAFSAMSYDNVETVPMAVSNRSGQLPLYTHAASTHFASLETRSENRGSGSENSSDSVLPAPSSKLLVDVTTLDEFFASPGRRGPDFLKIDVEGHELAVLEGGLRILGTRHPSILVECEARHRADGVRPVFDLLQSLGYTGSFFCRGRRHPLGEFDVGFHQRLDPGSDRLPDGYVNNFAFEFAR
jgi:FkbM family methyltransferase